MKRRTLVKSAGAAGLVWMPGMAVRAENAARNTIRIGQSAALSGPVGSQVQTFNKIASLVFEGVNRSGGIGGQPLELISLDDELQPAKTLANCERLLLQDRVVARFGMVGSANLVSIQPLLEKTGVPVVGAIGVSDLARQKTRDSAYYVWAGYGREVSKIVQQLATIGAQRIALACFANPGGDEVRAAFLQSLQELGIKPGATVAVNPDGSNIAACAATLARDRPQAVIMFIAGSLPAKLIESLDETLGEINRMTELVEGLLTLARADEGRAPLPVERTDLRDLVAEASETAGMLAESGRLKVTTVMPEAAVWVMVDRRRIREMLLNLVTNAIKYTPAEGKVELMLSTRSDGAAIIVRDTGIGIASNDLPHIFERFWRADLARSRTGERPGSGLGLAITKWIAEAHGGSITASSRPSRGTTLTVVLPLAESQSESSDGVS